VAVPAHNGDFTAAAELPGGRSAGLSGETAGDGPPIVLLHGLTATRRYVVMGSRVLEREGFRVIAYDARGHGESAPPEDPGAYDYDDLVADLETVLDEHELDSAALAGASMGAHTALALALRRPERVSALVLITPAYAGSGEHDVEELRGWDRLADGLDHGGVEGFIEAWQPEIDGRWREAALTSARQRLERHRHLSAVADALRAVPRSQPFGGLDDLRSVRAPSLLVPSRDESDPAHPLSVAERYRAVLPDAELIVEDKGDSPLAWQGAQLSRAIAAFLERRAA
jgi:pimeloyl-ACP methyl ester carboxylesterase